MVDDEVDVDEALLEEGGLHVDHGHPVEGVHLFRGDRLHVDLEDLAHGQVLRPRDGAEGADGSSRAVASEEGAQGEGGGDSVGIGVVLHQDEDPLGVVEVRAQPLGARAGAGALELGLEHPVGEGGGRHGDDARSAQPLLGYYEHGRVGDAGPDGRDHAREARGGRGDHERAAPLGEEPPVGRRVLGITDGGADLPPRETRPLGGGGDQIARRLAAEGNVAAQVGHEIFGHDQDGAHRWAPAEAEVS